MAKKNKKKVEEKKKGNEEEAKEEEPDNVAEDGILTPVEVKELKIRMTRTLNRKAKLNQKLDTYGTEAPIVIGGYEFDDAYFADDSMGSDEDKKNDVSETEPESENVFESEKTPVEEICVSEKPTEVNIVVDADELDEYLKKYALERFFAMASEPPEVLRCDKMTSAQSLEPSWNTQEVQTDHTEMEGHVKNYIWGTWPSDASEAQKVQRLQSNKRISATQSLKELNTQEVQTDEKTGVEFNGSVEDDFEDVIVKKTLQDFSCNVSLDVVESREKRDVSTADFGANVLDDFREVIERRRNLERRRRYYSQRSGDYGDGYSDDDAYTTSEDSLKELSNKYNFKVLESRYKPILTCRRTNLRMFDDGDDYCEEFDDDLKRRECITKPDINKDVAYNETEEGSGVKHPKKKSKRMVSHQVPAEEVSKRKSKKPPYDEFATDPQDDSSCSLVTNVIETKITFGNIKEDSDDDDDDDNFTQNPSIKSKQAGRVDLSVKNHIRGILTKPKLTPCKRIQFVDGRGAYRCVNIPSSCANNPEKSGDFTATSPVAFQQNPEDDVLLDNQDDYRYQKTPPINRKWENDVSTDAQEVGSFAPVQKLKRNPPQYVDSSPVAEGTYNAGSSPRSAGRTQIDVDDQCEDDQYEAEHIRSLAKALKEMWPAQGDAFNGVQKMDSATSPATEILRTTNRVDNNLRHKLLDNSYVVQSIDNYTSPSANADRKILLVDNDEAYENVGVYTMSPTNAPRRPTILNDSVHSQLVRNSRRTSSASNGGLHRNADLVLSCPEETYIVVDNPNQKPIKYIDISKEDYDELFEHENTPIKLVLQRDNEVDNELGMERDYLNDVSPVRGEPMVDQLLMDVPRKNCVAALPADVRRTLRDITNRSLKSKKTKADEFRDADDELTNAFLRNYCQCEPESNDSHSNSDCGCNSKNQKFRLVLEPADTGDHGSLNRKKRNEDQIRNRGITDDELRALKRAKRQELDDELCDRTEWECRRGDGSPVPQDTVVSRKHNHSSKKTSDQGIMHRSSGSVMLFALGLPLVANLEVIGNVPTLAEGGNTKQNTLPIRTAKLNRKKANVAARKVSSNYVSKVGGRFSKTRSLNKSRNKKEKEESGNKTKKSSRRKPAADGPPKTCTSPQSEVESELELVGSHSGKSLSDPDDSSPDPQLCAAELTLNSQKVTLKSPSIKPDSDSFFVCTRCGRESVCTHNNIQHQAVRHYSPLEQNNKDGDVYLTRSIDKLCMDSSESQTAPTPMNKTAITSHSFYNIRNIDDENLCVHGIRTLINDKTGEASDDEESDFLSDVKENRTFLLDCPTQQRKAEIENSEPNDQLGSVITLGEVEDKEDRTNATVVKRQKSQINLNNSHLGSDSGKVSGTSVAHQDDEKNIPGSKHGTARSGDVKSNQDTSKKSKRSANQEIDDQQEKRIKAHHEDNKMNESKETSTSKRDTQPTSEIDRRKGNPNKHLDVEDVGHHRCQERHQTPSFPRYIIEEVCLVGASSRCCDSCEANRILALLSQGVIQCEKRLEFANQRLMGPHYCEDSNCQSRLARHYDDRAGGLGVKTCTPRGCDICLPGCLAVPSGRICIDAIKPFRISTECQNASTSTRDEDEMIQHDEREYNKMLRSGVTCLVADDFRDAIEENYKHCNSDFSGDVRKDFKDYMADASASGSLPRSTSDLMRDAGPESLAQPNVLSDDEVNDGETKATDRKRPMYRKITVDPRDIIEYRKMHQIPLEGIESDEDVHGRRSEPLESRGESYEGVIVTAADNRSKTDTLTPERDKNERSYDNKESDKSQIDHRVSDEIENNLASSIYDDGEDDHLKVAHIDETSRNVTAETNKDEAVSTPMTGSSRPMNLDDVDDQEKTKTRGKEEVAYNVNDESRSIIDSTVREDMSEPVVTESNARTDTASNRTSSQIPDIEYENRISHPSKKFAVKSVSSVQNAAESSAVQSPIPLKVTSKDKATNLENTSFAETPTSAAHSPRLSKATIMDKADSQEKASFTETANKVVRKPSPTKVTSMDKATGHDQTILAEATYSAVQSPSPSKVTSMDKATSQEKASFTETANQVVRKPSPTKVTSMDKATSQDKASSTETKISEVKVSSPSKVVSMDQATIQYKSSSTETKISEVKVQSPSKVTSKDKATVQKAIFSETAISAVQSPSMSKVTSIHKVTSQDKAIFAETAYSAVQSPRPSKVTSMDKATSQDKASFSENEISEVKVPSPSKVTSMDKATSQEKASFSETAISAVQSPSMSKVTSMDQATVQEKNIFIENPNNAVQSPIPSKDTSMHKTTSQDEAIFAETGYSGVQSRSPSKVTSMHKAKSHKKSIFTENQNNALQSPIPSKDKSLHKPTSQDKAIFAEIAFSGVQIPSPSKVTSMHKTTSQEKAIFAETTYSAVQSPSPSKVTSMDKATGQDKASFTENEISEVKVPSSSRVTSMEKATGQEKDSFAETTIKAMPNRSLSKVTSMDKATSYEKAIFKGIAYSAEQSPSPSKARIMENVSSTGDAASPHRLVNAKKVQTICHDDNPEGFYTEIGQTLYSLLSRVDPQNITEDESADRLTNAINFLRDLIQSDLCLTRENYETSNDRGGSGQFNSRAVSEGDAIDKFKSLIESYYSSIGDTGTVIRENNKVIHLGEDGSTAFYFYDLFENKGVIEQNMQAKVVSRYDVACDVVEDFKRLWDEMDIQTQSTTEVGAGNVRASSRRKGSKRDVASSVVDDFEEEIMQRILTTACQTEEAYNEASEETEPGTQDHISSRSVSLSGESRTENREVEHQSSTDHDRGRPLLNEEDPYDDEEEDSPRNIAKTKSGSPTEYDDESQYIDEAQKYMDDDSGPDEIGQLSMHEEIPLSHNDLRKFSAVESTEHVSVANVGAVRSVSLQEEEMFNESAHHRVGKRPEWNSEVELRSNASSSPVRERKSHGSRSDEERKHRSIKDKGDDRRGRTTPESRDNVYKEHSSHKYHDDVDRGSDWHSTNEDQRCRVSPSESHDRQHTRSRNERQLQRPNSDTYVQKRITTPAGQDERLAYRPVESYRGKCSRDGTPRSHSPVFYEDGPPKGKALSRPVSPEEGSYEDDEHVSKSPYGSSRGRSSGSGNTKSCKCQTDFDDPHQPQKQTSDCEVRPKPQNYIEESRRFLAEHRNIRAALEVKCNREFFRSKTIIPPWQTRGPANIGRCCGHREDRYRLADRHCFSSRKYAHNATRPMDYQRRVDCVGSSPNNFDAAGPSPVSSCFARTIIPTCPTTECLSCVQNNAQPLYVQPPGNRAYTNYEMPVRFYTDPVALSNMYGKQPVAMSSVYTNQPVAMPCNCVNQPEPLPLFNNCPKVEFQNQTCSPMQMAGFYKEDCHDGSSWNENYISQGYVPAPAYSQERRVPRAWFKKAKDDDSDST